jgi:hypothetical protein
VVLAVSEVVVGSVVVTVTVVVVGSVVLAVSEVVVGSVVLTVIVVVVGSVVLAVSEVVVGSVVVTVTVVVVGSVVLTVSEVVVGKVVLTVIVVVLGSVVVVLVVVVGSVVVVTRVVLLVLLDVVEDVVVVVVLEPTGQASAVGRFTLKTLAVLVFGANVPAADPPKPTQYVSPPLIERIMPPAMPGFGGTVATAPLRPLIATLIRKTPVGVRTIEASRTGPYAPVPSRYLNPVVPNDVCARQKLPGRENVWSLECAPLATISSVAPLLIGSPTTKSSLSISFARMETLRRVGSVPALESFTRSTRPSTVCVAA